MALTRDNANDPRWPSRRIVQIHETENPWEDGEPLCQEIWLDCGHYLFNTYGKWTLPRAVGQVMRCRTCYRHRRTNGS